MNDKCYTVVNSNIACEIEYEKYKEIYEQVYG